MLELTRKQGLRIVQRPPQGFSAIRTGINTQVQYFPPTPTIQIEQWKRTTLFQKVKVRNSQTLKEVSDSTTKVENTTLNWRWGRGLLVWATGDTTNSLMWISLYTDHFRVIKQLTWLSRAQRTFFSLHETLLASTIYNTASYHALTWGNIVKM